MDRKSLILSAVVVASITLSFIPTTAQQDDDQRSGARSSRPQQTNARNHNEENGEHSLITPRSSSVEPPTANPQSHASQREPLRQRELWKQRLVRAIAPETWSNWTLAIFGIAGVLVGLCTLKSLRDQVGIAAKAVAVAETNVAIVARQFELEHSQWIDISRFICQPVVASIDGRSEFNAWYVTIRITNNTPQPLTINRIDYCLNGSGDIFPQTHTIGPHGRWTVPREVLSIKGDAAPKHLLLQGQVHWTNAIGVNRIQPFSRFGQSNLMGETRLRIESDDPLMTECTASFNRKQARPKHD